MCYQPFTHFDSVTNCAHSSFWGEKCVWFEGSTYGSGYYRMNSSFLRWISLSRLESQFKCSVTFFCSCELWKKRKNNLKSVLSCNRSCRNGPQSVFACVRCFQKCLFSLEAMKQEAVWLDWYDEDVSFYCCWRELALMLVLLLLQSSLSFCSSDETAKRIQKKWSRKEDKIYSVDKIKGHWFIGSWP